MEFRTLDYDVEMGPDHGADAAADHAADAAASAAAAGAGDGNHAATLGQRVARFLGVDPASVFKTLVVDVDGSPVVAVVPVDHVLDLKALAHVAGGKRAHLAEPHDAERLTGYVVGGISPLGQRHRLTTFVDDSVTAREMVMVNAGRRGMMVELASRDLLELTSGTAVAIAKA